MKTTSHSVENPIYSINLPQISSKIPKISNRWRTIAVIAGAALTVVALGAIGYYVYSKDSLSLFNSGNKVVTNLSNKVNELTTQLQSSESLSTELNQQIQTLKLSQSSLTSENVALKRQIEELQIKEKDLIANKSLNEQTIEKLKEIELANENAIKSLEDTVDQAEIKNKQWSTTVETLRGAFNQQEQKVEDLTKQLEELRTVNKQLDLDILASKVANLNSTTNTDLNSGLKDILEEKSISAKIIDGLRKDNSLLSEKNNQLVLDNRAQEAKLKRVDEKFMFGESCKLVEESFISSAIKTVGTAVRFFSFWSMMGYIIKKNYFH